MPSLCFSFPRLSLRTPGEASVSVSAIASRTSILIRHIIIRIVLGRDTAGGTIARTGRNATGIAIITELNIVIPDITMAGITIMIVMITGGIVGTTAGNGVRRRGLNSLFDKGGACPGVLGFIARCGLAPRIVFPLVEKKYLKTILQCHVCTGTLDDANPYRDREISVLDIDSILR